MTDHNPPDDREIIEVKPGMYAVNYTEAERRELYTLTDDDIDAIFKDAPAPIRSQIKQRIRTSPQPSLLERIRTRLRTFRR